MCVYFKVFVKEFGSGVGYHELFNIFLYFDIFWLGVVDAVLTEDALGEKEKWECDGQKPLWSNH